MRGYHGKVNKRNGSHGTFLIADNFFQKDCAEMSSDLIESVNHELVGLSFIFWQPDPTGQRVVLVHGCHDQLCSDKSKYP